MKNWILLLVAFTAMVTVNALANLLPINGQQTGEISDSVDVLFTPAGYVFSIWGVIYLLLAVWLFLLFKQLREGKEIPQRLTILFVLSCIFNICWLLTYHYEFFAVSIIIMIALLLTLITIYLSYPTGDSRFSGRLPFSIYLGWIAVATIANISFTLKYNDVSLGINEVAGTIVLLIIASAIAIYGRYRSDDPYFAVVFVWAIVGVAESNTNSSLVTTAYILAAVIFIAIIALSYVKKRNVAA
jgi:translocator protein